MNVKVEALDQHKVSLNVEVPAEAVQKGFKTAVARIANQVKIPGFRKGKASRKILEMHFGKEAVEAEAKDVVINDALNEALQQEKLIPVTTPDVKEDKFSESEGAVFTATFVKRPEVELGEYKGLEAEHAQPGGGICALSAGRAGGGGHRGRDGPALPAAGGAGAGLL